MNDHNKKELVEYLSRFVTPQKWEKLQKVAENRTRHLTVILEHLNQPLNMSAAIRSLEAFGIQDINVVDSHEFKSELNAGVAKGAQEWVTLNRYRGTEGIAIQECVKQLRAKGYSIVATMPHIQGESPEKINITNKSAIVFGNEEFGVSKYIEDVADRFLTIPMYGFTESFNVSVTVAMCMHTLIERLRVLDIDWHLSDSERCELFYQWLKKSLGCPEGIERNFFEKIRG